ncbi:MAG: hypothetical protein HY741_28555 [Chloroflexi bacterium]|nr:hypothetical protein [Chloroflexota bacterium]
MKSDFRVTTDSAPRVQTALKAMQDAQLIRALDEPASTPDTRAFQFKHTLVQDTAYASLMRSDRRRLHQLVGKVLEQQASGRESQDAALLGHHFYEAGDFERALGYLRRAGETAAQRYENREAIAFFTQALDAAQELNAPDRSARLHARGTVYERIGAFDAARADFEHARRLAHTAHDAHAEWASLMSLGYAWSARDYARTGEYFEKALDLARESQDPRRLAHTLNRVGNWYTNNEAPDQARALQHEALAIFETFGDAHGAAETHDLLGMTELVGADFFAGQQHLRDAQTLFRVLDDQSGIVTSGLSNLLYMPSLQGESLVLPPTEKISDRALEEILAATRQLGWRAGEAYALWVSGEGFAAVGAYGHALELETRALALAREIDHRQWLTAATMLLGAIHGKLLDFDTAQTLLDQAAVLAREIGSPHGTRTASGFRASVYIERGEFARAEKTLDAVLTQDAPARTLGQRQAWTARVELALARRDPERALEWLDHILRDTANLTPDVVIPRLWLLRAEALVQRERYGEAEGLLEQAREAAQARDLLPLLWQAASALCIVYRAQGRLAEAERAAETAARVVNTIAATIPQTDVRERFRAHAYQLVQAAGASV